MSYSRISPQNYKDSLAQINQEKLAQFKLNNQPHLEIYHPSLIPGILARSHPDKYHKEIFALNDLSSISLIEKNDDFDSFVWHTDAAQIEKANYFGILKTQSICGNVIGMLGQYRLQNLKRLTEGYVSNRFTAKETFVTLYQDRIALLQDLESLVNRENSKTKIEETLDHYIQKLKFLADEIYSRFVNTGLLKFDKDIVTKIIDSLNADIKRAEDFKKSFDVNSVNASTGLGSALTFVKTQMLRHLRELQGFNQMITYSRSFAYAATRGQLSNYVEDAVRIIDEFEAPPHDCIEPFHHGIYGRENEKIIYASSKHCSNARQTQDALLAITFLEKANQAHVLRSKAREIQATQWKINGGLVTGIKKILAWFANIVIKIIFGIPDLLTLGLITPLSQCAAYEIQIKNPDAPQLNCEPIFKKAKSKKYSLGVKFRYFLGNIFRNTIQDIWYGIKDIYHYSFHLFDQVYNDYYDGVKEPKLNHTFSKVDQEIILIKTTLESQKKYISEKLPDDYTTDIQNPKQVKKVAEPEFLFDTGEWDDLLNAAARGGNQFMGFFLHNIHAKHPFTGLLFSLTYAAGASAILAPQFVSFLGPKYIAFAEKIGTSMAKNKLSVAISSGCTQAQIAAVGFEFLLNGPNSWLVSGAIDFEKDPATSLMYMSTAVGLGYTLVFKLNIPWFSEHFRKDLGAFPPSALGFVGLKLGLLVYELLNEHKNDVTESKVIKKIKAYLAEEYHAKHPKATKEEVAQIVENMLATLLQSENISKLKEAYLILQGQDSRAHIENVVKQNSLTQLELQQLQLLYYLEQNKNYLSQLSEKSKHTLINAIKKRFSIEKARSLDKLFHPEQRTSILRTTLGIVTRYITYPLRLLISMGSSLLQLSPKPFISAAKDFLFNIAYDLTRLARGISKFFKAMISFPRRQLKSISDVFFNSFLARTETLLTNQHQLTANNHAVSAECDVAYEKLRQISPVDFAIKNVTSAHPLSTFKKSESSWSKIFQAISYLPDNQEDKFINSSSPGAKNPLNIKLESSESKELTRKRSYSSNSIWEQSSPENSEWMEPSASPRLV